MGKDTRLSGLVMDMRQGDVVTLGHNIKIHFLEKSGRITRVRIAAPVDVKIRKESEKGEECRYATQGSAI